jgi:hypothetical protein
LVLQSSSVSDAERKTLEDEQREREYQAMRCRTTVWLISADLNPRALQVQRLLEGELNPLTMGALLL